jgi:hypothetical protein
MPKNLLISFQAEGSIVKKPIIYGMAIILASADVFAQSIWDLASGYRNILVGIVVLVLLIFIIRRFLSVRGSDVDTARSDWVSNVGKAGLRAVGSAISISLDTFRRTRNRFKEVEEEKATMNQEIRSKSARIYGGYQNVVPLLSRARNILVETLNELDRGRGMDRKTFTEAISSASRDVNNAMSIISEQRVEAGKIKDEALSTIEALKDIDQMNRQEQKAAQEAEKATKTKDISNAPEAVRALAQKLDGLLRTSQNNLREIGRAESAEVQQAVTLEKDSVGLELASSAMSAQAGKILEESKALENPPDNAAAILRQAINDIGRLIEVIQREAKVAEHLLRAADAEVGADQMLQQAQGVESANQDAEQKSQDALNKVI